MAIIVHRSQIQKQTIDNLIAAGILSQSKADYCNEMLSTLPIEELLSVLVDSHQIRTVAEQSDACPVLATDVADINLN